MKKADMVALPPALVPRAVAERVAAIARLDGGRSKSSVIRAAVAAYVEAHQADS